MERKIYEGKSPKAIKDAVRADAITFLIDVIAAAVGEEFVSRVESNMIAFSFGDTILDSGETVEIPICISPTIKDYADGETSTGKERKAYDRIKESEFYEDEVTAKIAEKAEKAKQKAAKIARDKAAREKKKKE